MHSAAASICNWYDLVQGHGSVVPQITCSSLTVRRGPLMPCIAISSTRWRDCSDGYNDGFLDTFVDVDCPTMAIHCASCIHEACLQNNWQQSTVPLLFLVFWSALTILPFAWCVNMLCWHYGYLERTSWHHFYFCGTVIWKWFNTGYYIFYCHV